ncbi:hypothetical protein C1646_773071 [Rhizophagus diaphanus]|nr:hypothetical protein C1646_773071 [Rhizophagus diaphanus] [Rhizophagus sp. MUCL 43196]
MLENDKVCASYLKELKKKGMTYDRLWNKKLYSEILAANHIKKGYYIRHVKNKWKNDNNVKKAYRDLYSLKDSGFEKDPYL